MRGAVHDGIRRLIGGSLVALGRTLEVVHRRRLRSYRETQARLRERFGIGPRTPIVTSLDLWPAEGDRIAETSGTRDRPKEVPFGRERLEATKRVFIDVFARAYARHPIRRKSLYVFSPLEADRSLTGLLTEEEASRLALLQAPYRIHATPVMRALATRYSAEAVRLLVLATSNPGVVYATNPSTLVHFLETAAGDWDRARAAVKDHVERPDPEVAAVLTRIASKGDRARLRRIAEATAPIDVRGFAPALEAYITWTGGYVAPFLDRLDRLLPPDRYRRLPMYSMSTETIETIGSYEDGASSFVPMAPGVLYEFLPEGAPDDPDRLIQPWRLETGGLYSMVVSNAYGLRRYQTGDVFRCERFTTGLPDLAFVRRRDLSYSFTGEKLTGEQVALAIERMGAEVALAGVFLSLIPSTTGGPHYRLAVIGEASVDASRFDRILSDINGEYAAKRASGRLGPIEVSTTTALEIQRRMTGSAADLGPQFKLLPLYRRTWEDGGG